MSKAEKLRKQYPQFIYEGCSWRLSNRGLAISFSFSVPPDITFKPTLLIEGVTEEQIKRVGEETVENFVFHLGLMEMPSYWKATASPEILVKAGSLNEAQMKWWKRLFLEGMGQYFYENSLNIEAPNIRTERRESIPAVFKKRLSKRALVPIGGGKDSIVTLELLKKQFATKGFILNPKKEQKKIAKIAGLREVVVAKRTIDPALLELNKKGYLNGHTPFSAYLAFLSLFCAVLFDCAYVAVSNERSSNEGNLRYKGKEINHQYSKSFDFEKRFRAYAKKYLTSSSEYFSFLRPLYELQIARIFSRFPQYFSSFLSCNEAYKTHSASRKPLCEWCGACAKCLFAFAVLYPFLEEGQLVSIFQKNLFEDKSLIPFMKDMVGEGRAKPWECVGTFQESRAALFLSLEKVSGEIPVLLRYFKEHILPKYPDTKRRASSILHSWNSSHALPPLSEQLLKAQEEIHCKNYCLWYSIFSFCIARRRGHGAAGTHGG